MAGKSRRTAATVIALLESDPARFGFFQAVRLLEWHTARAREGKSGRAPVGGDGHPANETVRFRASMSLEHPVSEISRLHPPKGDDPYTLDVAFMGLIGPSGVLPEHYTEHLIEVTRQKNTAYRDFLDMLGHRSISLFYRAWARQQLPVALERRQFAPDPAASRGEGDLMGKVLASLAGLGTPGLDGPLPFGRDLALHHAGQLANRRRSAETVRALAQALLERPVEIRQFQGAWLAMEPDARTRLPGRLQPSGQHAQLGVSAVLGARAWDVHAGFTIRIGPVTLTEFRDLMPDGAMLPRLKELIRFIVGPAQSFAVQPVLKGDQVPPCRIGAGGARLGWDSWIGARDEAAANGAGRDDALFSADQPALARIEASQIMEHSV